MARSSQRTALGVLGGTFDPVHHGHLRTAVEVAAAVGLGEVRLIPAGLPPHRAAPAAPAELRWRMLAAAVAGKSGLVPDNRELRRAGPSYTVDTLAELRTELGDRPLCLILGADAFAGLPTWHRYRELLTLAHVVVVHRPGYPVAPDGGAGELLAAHRAPAAAALGSAPAGLVWLQAVTPLAISASAIRATVADGVDPAYLVPDAVRDLILDTGCYARAAAGHVPSSAGPARS